MSKRWSIPALALPALLLLGGCAIEPAYRYNANAGGGYYQGQSPYGGADTVIQGNVYVAPWGPWSPWGPAFGTFDWSYPAWGFGAWGSYGGYFRYRHPYYRIHGHAARPVPQRQQPVRQHSVPTPSHPRIALPPDPDRPVQHPDSGHRVNRH